MGGSWDPFHLAWSSRPRARLAFLTTRCEFRRRKKKLSWRRPRPQHRFATKGSFPPSSLLLPPSFLTPRPSGSARGERRARAPHAGDRPRLVTGAPKGYVNRGGLRRRGRQRARERDRARARPLSHRQTANLSGPRSSRSMGPLFAST